MLERTDGKPEREVGDATVKSGRASTQMGWYRFAARRIAPGRTVLDAGCGLGHGLAELRTTAAAAVGQDLDPRLERDGVMIGPIEDLADRSYDVVVCIDVVEHVTDDAGFMRQLARVARQALFLTTPLSAYGRPLWPYHVREYRAREFHALLQPIGRLTYFIGTPSGSEIFEVRNMAYFWTIDALINWPVSNLPFRALQKILPRRLRYNSHHAILVQLA